MLAKLKTFFTHQHRNPCLRDNNMILRSISSTELWRVNPGQTIERLLPSLITRENTEKLFFLNIIQNCVKRRNTSIASKIEPLCDSETMSDLRWPRRWGWAPSCGCAGGWWAGRGDSRAAAWSGESRSSGRGRAALRHRISLLLQFSDAFKKFF